MNKINARALTEKLTGIHDGDINFTQHNGDNMASDRLNQKLNNTMRGARSEQMKEREKGRKNISIRLLNNLINGCWCGFFIRTQRRRCRQAYIFDLYQLRKNIYQILVCTSLSLSASHLMCWLLIGKDLIQLFHRSHTWMDAHCLASYPTYFNWQSTGLLTHKFTCFISFRLVLFICFYVKFLFFFRMLWLPVN